MAQDPAVVANLVTSAPRKYDNLMALKEAVRWKKKSEIAGATYALTQVPRDIRKVAESVIPPDFEDYWREAVLMPLRHHTIQQGITKNILDGGKLKRQLDKFGPSYLNEVFDGPENVKRLYDLATTAETVSTAPKASKIFIQLIQGGQLVSLAGGVTWGAMDSEDWERKVGGGMAIFVSPVVLAKALTNPRLSDAILKGFRAGPKSRPFARAVQHLSAIAAAEHKKIPQLTPEQRRYYDVVPAPGEAEPSMYESQMRGGIF
jgi:hypothetical protein